MATKWSVTLLVSSHSNTQTETEHLEVTLGDKADQNDVKEALKRNGILNSGYTRAEIIKIEKV